MLGYTMPLPRHLLRKRQGIVFGKSDESSPEPGDRSRPGPEVVRVCPGGSEGVNPEPGGGAGRQRLTRPSSRLVSVCGLAPGGPEPGAKRGSRGESEGGIPAPAAGSRPGSRESAAGTLRRSEPGSQRGSGARRHFSEAFAWEAAGVVKGNRQEIGRIRAPEANPAVESEWDCVRRSAAGGPEPEAEGRPGFRVAKQRHLCRH